MTTTTPRPYGPLKWRLPPVLVRLDDPTESLARSVSRNRPAEYPREEPVSLSDIGMRTGAALTRRDPLDAQKETCPDP